MGKADSRLNEKVEGSRYFGICGTSIWSYASQLALSCKARLWHHKAGSKKIKICLAKFRKDRLKNIL